MKHDLSCFSFALDMKIFGDNFLEMSREDIGYLFPNNFVLDMKLYKIIQSCRQVHDLSLTESECEHDNMSSMSNSSTSATSTILGKRSDKASSSSTTSETKRAKNQNDGGTRPEFLLPVFSEDIQKSFLEDSIFTTPQCNKIIRECCRALQGYCQQHEVPVTSELKKHAAKLLSEKCPNSLGVEVHMVLYE